MIQTQKYEIKNLFITNELLTSYINLFWNKTFSRLVLSRKDIHLLLLVKVQFLDNEMGYKTLADLRKVNFDDKELFTNYLIARLGILSEAYITLPISKIEFSYVVKKGIAINTQNHLEDIEDKVTSTTHRFNNLQLPISMNPSDYGDISNIGNYETFTRHTVINQDKVFQIDVSIDKLINTVKMLGAIDLSWTDTQISNDVFKRDIGKNSIYFMGKERILLKKVLTTKSYTPLKTDSILKNNFVTMDIETITVNNIITPYLICAYNGIDYITSYAKMDNGVIDQKDLFNSFIDQLLTFFGQNKTLIVYAHNLSGFDGVLLMKYLIPFGKIDPVIFNSKLMSIKIKLNIDGHKNKTIIFKDSYLLLPNSLRNLCSAFNIELPKGYFPFKLINIYYTGILPAFEYWTGIDLKTYNELLKDNNGKMWNFKDQAIKYCHLDCKCLFEILIQFNNLIFNNFKLNIDKSLTLPSLAMRIYKSQFMPKDTIYQLNRSAEKDIRQAYTGGAVDIYIPTNRKNIISLIYTNIRALFTKLYYYDVNSLYPFIMANIDMPVGKPVAFEGDITKIDPNAFGYFYCNITSPSNIKHPLLQRKIKTSQGIRTIAGLGSWTGWIFSTEMYNAMKFGYTFEIIKGYEFERGNIFKEYVNKMYSLRMEYSKGHPMNLIAKLLMNSLYGKFGMKSESTVIDIYDSNNEFELDLFNTVLDAFDINVKDWIKIDNYYLLIRKNLLAYSHGENDESYHGLDVNVAIAAAVTSGGRVWMSTIKNSSKANLYYSDTDSAVTDRPLHKDLVGPNLGQFKLEYVIKKAVFLAPKVYALITSDNKLIIKCKGVTQDNIKDLNFNDIENLLIKDSSMVFNQEKWFKNLIKGEITTKEIIYTLKATYN